jgi:prolyl oligopeptidase
VVIAVGSLNSTRSEFTESGPANIPEFGSVTNSKQFPYVLAMDAYQHVKDGTPYPAVLLTGGYEDPLVGVWEPAKMAARLQAATFSGRPVLLRIDFNGGHEPALARAKHDEETDEFAFLLWQFGQK